MKNKLSISGITTTTGFIACLIIMPSFAAAPTEQSQEQLTRVKTQTRAQAKPDPRAEQIVHFDYLNDQGELSGELHVLPAVKPAMKNPFADESAATPSPPPDYGVSTLINNGASQNRIDLVIVGDGYRTTDLSQYAAQADSIIANFFAESPLLEYASYYNVHRVDVVSNESGVDNDPNIGIDRDTALDMGFWCNNSERLLCVNLTNALNAAAIAPEADQVLAIANSSKYGGAGYAASNLGTLAANNSGAIELALHEYGHSFAELADEYDYGGAENYTGNEPYAANVSTFDYDAMITQQTKWHQWLGDLGVATYEGAYYSRFGIFRPTENSKMRSLGQPFDAVNIEQFIIKTYEIVSPIDNATPSGGYDAGIVLEVNPMQPNGHNLEVQWWLNGSLQPTTGLLFDTTGLSGEVAVRVVDNTPWVRNEAKRNSLMTAERIWQIYSVADADLEVSLSDETNNSQAYVIQLTNNGPDTAHNIQLQTRVTSATDNQRAQIISMDHTDCSAATRRCEFATLSPSDSIRVRVEVSLSSREIQVDVTASVSASTPDSEPGNNYTSARYAGSLSNLLLIVMLPLLMRRLIKQTSRHGDESIHASRRSFRYSNETG